MQFKKLKILSPIIFSALIALGLSIAIQSLFAWTAPTALPPENNISGLLNSGPDWQTKQGSLTTNTDGLNPYGLIVENGNTGLGTSTPSADLTIQASAGQNSLFVASSTGEHVMSVDQSGRLRIGDFISEWAPETFDTGSTPQGLIISGDNKDLSLVSVGTGDTIKADIDFYRAEGTLTSPQNIDSTTDLGQINFRGYYNNAFTDRLASISVWTDGTPSATSLPTRLEFYITGVNQTRTEDWLTPEMVIKSSGYIGIGTDDPKTKLELNNGDIYINTAGRKIIMKSPDLSCSACGPDNSDIFVCSPVACP